MATMSGFRLWIFLLMALAGAAGCEKEDAFFDKRLESNDNMQAGLRDRLISAIKFSDEGKFVKTVNDIKKDNSIHAFVPLFKNFWAGNCTDCGDFHKDFLYNKYVRIEVADFLAHAIVNGIMKDDPGNYLDFAVSLMGDDDDYIVGRCLYVMGLIGGQREIDLIINTTLTREGDVFRMAVVALFQSCKIDEAIYYSVSEKVSDINKKKYMKDVWERMMAQRARWCDR